ncbi:hypothetical protein B0H19DRAFT_967011 [Mycena capillaripes]|nr:hypothetical protein B0H19DRAFT_967011 [Mycena capillaripes]
MFLDLRLDGLGKNVKHLYELHLSQHAPRLAASLNALIILPVVAAFLLLSFSILCFSRLSRRPNNKPSDALQALFTVIAPTSVAWPREYASLVTHSISTRSKNISISMSSLIGKVCGGEIEVRNYADLSDLFLGNLVVYGWRVSLALDTLWNFEVLGWVVGSYFWRRVFLLLRIPHLRQPLKRLHGASQPKPTDSGPSASASLFPSFSLTSNAHLDLDHTPFSALEPVLLELRTTLAPGTFATLEFTTPAPHVTFPSPQFTLCAIPFLPRKHARACAGPNATSIAPARTRTATPLLASLHRVLELLTAGSGALALENVSNMSKQYTNGLTAAAAHLEDDRAARAAFVHQWGVAGWREQRLMMGWEAALFSARLLTRWVVVVVRK